MLDHAWQLVPPRHSDVPIAHIWTWPHPHEVWHDEPWNAPFPLWSCAQQIRPPLHSAESEQYIAAAPQKDP